MFLDHIHSLVIITSDFCYCLQVNGIFFTALGHLFLLSFLLHFCFSTSLTLYIMHKVYIFEWGL